MATRKKKAEVTEDGVKVVKGSHLTVYTYPDGKTELEWDDDALMRDVQEALALGLCEPAPAKKSRRKTNV
jgi:hypothetical protein